MQRPVLTHRRQRIRQSCGQAHTVGQITQRETAAWLAMPSPSALTRNLGRLLRRLVVFTYEVLSLDGCCDVNIASIPIQESISFALSRLVDSALLKSPG